MCQRATKAGRSEAAPDQNGRLNRVDVVLPTTFLPVVAGGHRQPPLSQVVRPRYRNRSGFQRLLRARCAIMCTAAKLEARNELRRRRQEAELMGGAAGGLPWRQSIHARGGRRAGSRGARDSRGGRGSCGADSARMATTPGSRLAAATGEWLAAAPARARAGLAANRRQAGSRHRPPAGGRTPARSRKAGKRRPSPGGLLSSPRPAGRSNPPPAGRSNPRPAGRSHPFRLEPSTASRLATWPARSGAGHRSSP